MNKLPPFQKETLTSDPHRFAQDVENALCLTSDLITPEEIFVVLNIQVSPLDALFGLQTSRVEAMATPVYGSLAKNNLPSESNAARDLKARRISPGTKS